MSGEQAIAQAAVNVDPRESNLRPIDPAVLARIAPHELVTGLDSLQVWLAQARGQIPLWPLLLGAALLLFIVEAILSNLLARRRSQGNTTHIETGRLNKRRMGVPFR